MGRIRKTPGPDWKRDLARVRARSDIGEKELRETITHLTEAGVSPTEIAAQLLTSKPRTYWRAVKGRTSLAEVVPSSALGDSPYHVAERYSRNEISREQVIEALTKWHYVSAESKTAGLHEDLLNVVAGSFDEVQAASLDDLIDEDVYAAALDALRAQTAAFRQTDGE